MTDHALATREDWLKARLALLAEEKKFTRLRDALGARRRALDLTALGRQGEGLPFSMSWVRLRDEYAS